MLLLGSTETGEGFPPHFSMSFIKLPHRSQTTEGPSKDPSSDWRCGKFPSPVSYSKYFCLTIIILAFHVALPTWTLPPDDTRLAVLCFLKHHPELSTVSRFKPESLNLAYETLPSTV